jgi:diketogulonate reductase-like aldo/keto reductase
MVQVHWPVPGKHVDAYLELEKLVGEGKIRSIGMSNYAVEDYKELMEKASIKPTINQIEVNPFLYRKQTIDFFQKEGVEIQSYRALRDGQSPANVIDCITPISHSSRSLSLLKGVLLKDGCRFLP